jgi:hypothetical protein
MQGFFSCYEQNNKYKRRHYRASASVIFIISYLMLCKTENRFPWLFFPA